MADPPALPERLSDAEWEDRFAIQADESKAEHLRRAAPVASPAEHECGQCGFPVPCDAVASPRREAPADAVEALADLDMAEALHDWLALTPGTLAPLGSLRAVLDGLHATFGYQRVPADHHVSRVGHVWKDGRLWRVEIHVEDDGSERVCPRAYLRPVGTEEADTDERG